MSLNILDISILCPIKFRQRGYVNPLPYNWKYFDDWNFPDTIKPWEEQVCYCHPWQKNDIIYIPILSNYAPHNITVVDENQVQIPGATFVANYIPTSIEGTGQKFYLVSIALNAYNDGAVQVWFDAGSPVLVELESEWLYIKDLHENTILLKYSHNENDFDIPFETGVELMFRIFGGLTEFKPAADRTVFIDQTRSAVQLSSKAYYTQKLLIGDARGVPDWVIERVNQIFQCSYVSIDGRQYVANDGASFDPNREENYPMSGWGIEVRPADQKNRKRYEADGNSNNPTTVVYNIEGDEFGAITGPGSSNIIQIAPFI